MVCWITPRFPRGGSVARIGLKQGFESHIVVVGIKAGMVGNVEEIGRVLESEALGELRLLDDRRIRARLERTRKMLHPPVEKALSTVSQKLPPVVVGCAGEERRPGRVAVAG